VEEIFPHRAHVEIPRLLPAEKLAVERERRFVIGRSELVPGELTWLRDVTGSHRLARRKHVDGRARGVGDDADTAHIGKLRRLRDAAPSETFRLGRGSLGVRYLYVRRPVRQGASFLHRFRHPDGAADRTLWTEKEDVAARIAHRLRLPADDMLVERD